MTSLYFWKWTQHLKRWRLNRDKQEKIQHYLDVKSIVGLPFIPATLEILIHHKLQVYFQSSNLRLVLLYNLQL